MELFKKIFIFLLAFTLTFSEENFSIIPQDESNLPVINPDQGFHQNWYIVMNETTFYLRYRDIPDSLYRLLIDISAFSKKTNGKADIPITEVALKQFDEFLIGLREDGKNAIVRFAYDPGLHGSTDTECEMDMVQTHIKQLSQVLNKYPDIITSIEAGMLGRWAEMHGGAIVTTENLNILIGCWLNNTEGIPITVRQPKFIYNYFGKTYVEEMKDIRFTPEEKGYYLGMFNDGMYGGESDCSTWLQGREKELNWLIRQNEHLPYGGETEYRENEKRGNDIYLEQYSIPEMFKIHLTNLNIKYNTIIHDFWKSEIYDASIAGHEIFNGQTAYQFIAAHFGYRLVVKDINVKKNENKIEISIEIANNGFGYVLKKKKLGLVYSYDNIKIIKEENDLGYYIGNQTNIVVQGNLVENPTNDYYVFLRMYSDYNTEKKKVYYPVRFANYDIFNEDIQGNYLFTVDKENENIF